MIDVTFMVETVKRHWKALLVALVASLVLGGAYSYASSGGTVGKDTYTAELTIYVDGYEESPQGDFNYSLNEDYLINDCKRIFVSNSVAGEVRRELGEDVKIRIPYWSNPYTTGNLYSHFFYIQVSAPTEELALEAASQVADRGMAIIEESLPVSSVFLYEGPILKNGADETTNYGIDDLDVVSGSSLTSAARTISPKTMLVCAFCGILLVYCALLAADYLRRRIRSEHDVERLLGIPVVGAFASGPDDAGSYNVAALAVDSACKRHDLGKIALCTVNDPALLGRIRKGLDGKLSRCQIALSVDLLAEGEDLLGLGECDAYVLAVTQSHATGGQLAEAARILAGAQLPAIGALYFAK